MDKYRRALARLLGIQLSHYDGFGRLCEIDDELLSEIIRAQGVEFDGDYFKAFEKEKRKLLSQVLAPVNVSLFGKSPRILLNLPASYDGAKLSWNITEESGKKHEGNLGNSRAFARKFQSLEFKRIIFRPEVDLPMGYHELSLKADVGGEIREWRSRIIIHPERCFQNPAVTREKRTWGVVVNLYRLRSSKNWGVGDFADLERLSDVLAKYDCSYVGLNPILGTDYRGYAGFSPYTPSSRLALDFIYLDIEEVVAYLGSTKVRAEIESPVFRKKLEVIKSSELIPFEEVAKLKLSILRKLHSDFLDSALTRRLELVEKFRRYCERRSEALDHYLKHQADDSDSEFILFVQWQCDRQLKEVRASLYDKGFDLGLYLDFPLSASGGGADVSSKPDLYVREAGVGAPPDYYNSKGQNWGFPPPLSKGLQEEGYDSFVNAVRATMEFCNLVRIDHVLGLYRLYWIPNSRDESQGVYLRYRFNDLLGIVALESQRNTCAVVGEDLGTIPAGFQQTLIDRGMFSFRMLFFSKNWQGEFIPGHEFPQMSMLSVTTHDFPPLQGYLEFKDLEIRKEIDLLPGKDTYEDLCEARWREIDSLKRRLCEDGILENYDIDPRSFEFKEAILRFGEESNSGLLSSQFEDLIGETKPINIPGVFDQYPCWKIPLEKDLEDLLNNKDFNRCLEILSGKQS